MGVTKETCKDELRTAIRQPTDRCLSAASKWAAEQLVGIEQDPAKYPPSHTRLQRDCSSIHRRFRSTEEITSTPIAGTSYVSTPVPEEENEDADSDFYLLAKTYFSCREYRRAAHVLSDQTGNKALFLRVAAIKPVRIVLLTGTCVRVLTSEKNDGSKPSLDIAIKIRGFKTQNLILRSTTISKQMHQKEDEY